MSQQVEVPAGLSAVLGWQSMARSDPSDGPWLTWSCCPGLRSQPVSLHPCRAAALALATAPAPEMLTWPLPTALHPCWPFSPLLPTRRQHVCLTFEGMVCKQPLMHLLTSFFHCLNFKFFGCKFLKSVQYAQKGFARIWAELLPNGSTAPKKKAC